MGLGSMPFRARVANRVIDMLKKAAMKVGIHENDAERYVMKSILFPAPPDKDRRIIQARNRRAVRVRRRVARLSRAEQRRKGLYRRPQA